jgi:hypothetical protein
MSNHAVSEDQFHFFKWQNVTVDNFDVEGHILDLGGGGEGIIGRLTGSKLLPSILVRANWQRLQLVL